MGIKNAIYRGRARTVEDAVEAWKRYYDVAEKVKDIDYLVREWLGLADALNSWQTECQDLLHTAKLDNVLEVGKMLESAHRISMDLHEAVNDGVRWAKARGYEVEAASQFHEASMNLKKLRKRLNAIGQRLTIWKSRKAYAVCRMMRP